MGSRGNGSVIIGGSVRVTHCRHCFFVLVMEALNGLFIHAVMSGWFSPLRAPAIKYCLSLYADDLVIFLRTEAKDIRLACAILEFFTGVSGLHTNLSKCQFTPIRCSEE
jgi:hypothetical protein